MAVLSGMFIYLGHWGILIGALGSLIGGLLLSGGLAWCQQRFKFIMSAVKMHGPPALPIIGNALTFACSHEEMITKLVALAAPYNYPFRLWMGPKLFVCVRNPRDIEVVLNSSVATNKPYEYRFMASYLGRGIVTESGAIHRASRKLILPMVNGKVLDTFLQSFDKQSRRFIESLESKVDTGEFDVLHFMDDCTLDMVLETIMGTPGTAQQGGYKGLIHHLADGVALAHERAMKVWLYLDWIYARTKSGKHYAKAVKILHDFSETLIAKKEAECKAANSNPEFSQSDKPRTAVLDRLVAWNAQSKSMDGVRLRDEIANVWIAAQDPTAIITSFLFVMLGMHPDVQEKVRAEVREVLGDEDKDITMEDLAKLKYLEMVFKETLRLFPVGPIMLRELQADLDFEVCTAPKGCTIAIFSFMTHRDPKHWKDPEKFNPDRFSPENSAGRHPYAFIPFSGGIRGCIGRQYATMLVKTLAARVVQKYKIRCSGSLDSLPLKVCVSVCSTNGYKLSITKV